MDINFFFRGLVIGFSIAAPVGPVGVLCIQRTLVKGRAYGLLSGLGAATADAIYGCIAALGLTFISNFLIGQQVWLRLIGGGFLCYLGLKTFLSKSVKQTVTTKGTGLVGAYVSTFFLTVTNPMTIISFVAIFVGLGVGGTSGNSVSAAALVLGVFIGSALWWFILSGCVAMFRARFKSRDLRWVSRISGIIITAFGLIVLLSLIK